MHTLRERRVRVVMAGKQQERASEGENKERERRKAGSERARERKQSLSNILLPSPPATGLSIFACAHAPANKLTLPPLTFTMVLSFYCVILLQSSEPEDKSNQPINSLELPSQRV